MPELRCVTHAWFSLTGITDVADRAGVAVEKLVVLKLRRKSVKV